MLNAFVDDQLEPGEKDLAFDEIARDEALSDQVRRLRELKAMVQHAYNDPPVQRPYPQESRYSQAKRGAFSLRSLAACSLLLALGGVSGWFFATLGAGPSRQDTSLLFQANAHSDPRPKSGNILIQVDNSDPVRVRTALDESENLLETSRRAHKDLHVEIIANNSGIDLLRSGVSPYARRIALMQAKYPNLRVVACKLTVDRLRDKGVTVHLLPRTGSVTSAYDEISMRLHEGWDYIRI